jgi:hypothetical protein
MQTDRNGEVTGAVFLQILVSNTPKTPWQMDKKNSSLQKRFCPQLVTEQEREEEE